MKEKQSWHTCHLQNVKEHNNPSRLFQATQFFTCGTYYVPSFCYEKTPCDKSVMLCPCINFAVYE